MAHFMKLTQALPHGQADEALKVLFNLDTIISVEPDGSQSIIQTRFGRVMVQEDVDTIYHLANSQRTIRDPFVL